MDQAFFQAYIWPVRASLFRFSSQLMGNKSEGEDIAQEVLVKAWQYTKWKEVENWEAWCITVAKNMALDRLRARKSYACQDELRDHPSSQQTPEGIAEANELQSHYHTLLQQLPAQQRALMILREEEGKSYKEIAVLLNINLGLVKATLSRARQEIKSSLIKLGVYGQS